MERRVGDLEVKVGIILQRLDATEEWVGESRAFHREMNTFKDTFLATQQAIREEQNRRHRSNSVKLNVIGVLIAIGTLLITIASFMAVNFFQKHADLADPIKIFHSQQAQPALSYLQNPKEFATE